MATTAANLDLAIVGAGVGGYVAAIRASQLGLKTAIVEEQPVLGGTCLNWGCIPSKALLESSELYETVRQHAAEHGVTVPAPGLDLARMLQRKADIVAQLTGGVAQLLKKNRVQVIRGRATLAGPQLLRVVPADGEPVDVAARHLLLAPGSAPVALPFLPFDGERVVTSTEALAFPTVPDHLIVVGAGAVGLELGSVWRRLGARVTVVELLPRLLPFADRQVAQALQRALKAQGLDILLDTRVTAASVGEAGVQLTVTSAKGGESTLTGDRVLVAVGRRPRTAGLGLTEFGIALAPDGRIPVDATFTTAVPSIRAIGDAVAGPMLAHKAAEEGVAVAELLAGKPGHVNAAAIPSVVYTHPELACVGLSEDDAKERGLDVRVGRFLFRANGRALSLGSAEGLVKIVADAETDRVLGVHIAGPRASDLIAEAVLAIEFSASAEDLARTMHAHPTLAEALKEAALDVDKRAIHA